MLSLARQFLGLRKRFVANALELHGKTGPVLGQQGAEAARITLVRWDRRKLTVAGHARPGQVRLRLGTLETSAQVNDADGHFQLTLLLPLSLQASVRPVLDLPGFGPKPLSLPSLRLARLRLTGKLVWTLVRLLPDIHAWRSRQSLESRARVKTALGFEDHPAYGPLDAGLLTGQPHRTGVQPGTGIVIVLPVFNAHDILAECLDRIAAHTDLPWTLIAVDDASSDPRILPLLRGFAATRPDGRVHLLEAPENRGFVASVNTAFAHLDTRPALRDMPVVLLNSDALVPPGWASRLIRPLHEIPEAASVTPMSNDAEICSVPVICAHGDVTPAQARAVDDLARTLPPSQSICAAPTGVGFCMALNPAFLQRVPRFDTAFGRGYGEEVDWCQKTRALDGIHLCCADLFVEHHGGGSFGTSDKQVLVARHNQIISDRYPDYDQEVQDFLLTDPLRTARLALGMAWADGLADAAGTPIYLAHSMGGGADKWLVAHIRKDLDRGRPSVVLRIGGLARWQLELHAPRGITGGWTDDFTLVQRLLEPLSARRIIYSCGAGDRDPLELPQKLLALRRGELDRIEVLFHDYLPISPSFSLLDGAGIYRGAITPDRLTALPAPAARAFLAHRADGRQVPLTEWQAEWGKLLDQAALIRVFCPSGAGIVSEVWPHLADRITVSPHQLLHRPPRVPTPPPGQRHVLAVLGNIAPHKGARVVQQLAALSAGNRGADMVLIGNIDPAYPLSRQCHVHGDYSPADIPTLVAHYGITHWLIPSVWPETFSFTTREALATGLPVLAFDLGAQGDAVRNAENGMPLPYTPGGDMAGQITEVLKRGLQTP